MRHLLSHEQPHRLGVFRHPAEQNAHLRHDQRVEQQREYQDHGQQGDDHHERRGRARQAEFGKVACRGVKKIGDAGSGNEGQQHRGEQAQHYPEGNNQAGQQSQTLGAGSRW